MYRRPIDLWTRFVSCIQRLGLGMMLAVVLTHAIDGTAMAQCPDSGVRYVHPNGDDDQNSGLCWEGAYRTLNKALGDLHAPFSTVTTIRLAGFDGTSGGVKYRLSDVGGTPGEDWELNGSFVITKPCIIEGGWQGVSGEGGSPGVRDIALYPTILSGDLDGDDDPEAPSTLSDNAYHVVYVLLSNFAVDETVRLDGLTIRDGHALHPFLPGDRQGGGVLAVQYWFTDSDRLEVLDCRIESCSAALRAGAMLVEWFHECDLRGTRIEGNTGGFKGGVVVLEYVDHTAIAECLFRGNDAGGLHGGGLYSYESGSVRIANTIMDGNVALGDGATGGAIWYGNSSGGDLHLMNCLLVNNVADHTGGAIYFSGDALRLSNCTVANNHALQAGGVSSLWNLTVENSIVYGNTASSGSTFSKQLWASGFPPDPDPDPESGWPDFIVKFSCVEGIDEEDGIEVVDVDPEFIDAEGGDFRLLSSSPLIDQGSDTLAPLDLTDLDLDDHTTDQITPWPLDGPDRERIICVIDMGAYEFRPTCMVADINDDGTVDGNDMAIILGSWGACPGCPADLNGDGVVNGNDLAIVLGTWGVCSECVGELSMMMGGQGGGLTPEVLAAIFAFEDVGSFAAWLETLDFGTMSSILSLLIEE